MNIAIDFDGTITADVKLFNIIIDVIKQAGHKVYIVTGRSFSDDCLKEIERTLYYSVPIIFCTPYTLKRDMMLSLGIKIDIWVDNEPGTIEPCKILKDGKDEEL